MKRNIRRIFLFAIVIAFSFVTSRADEKIIGDPKHLAPVTYGANPFRTREGYALGLISRTASDGLIVKTLEGELKLGRRSTSGGPFDQRCYDNLVADAKKEGNPSAAEAEKEHEIKDKKGFFDLDIFDSTQEVVREQSLIAAFKEKCTDYINPWKFSAQDEDLGAQLQKLGDQMVMVFYRSFVWMPFVESDNIIEKIFPTNANIQIENTSIDVGMPISDRLSPAKGFYDGRVVVASYEGVLRKAFEVIVQLGNSGDVYRKLSVNEKSVFDFIVDAMTTDRMLRLYYYRLLAPIAIPINAVRGYDTYYRVYRVEILRNEESEENAPAPQSNNK